MRGLVWCAVLNLCSSIGLSAQAPRWEVYEHTSISGTISGTVEMGYVFQTISGNYYQVAEPIVEVVVEVMPGVLVLQSGELYRLVIDGFDEPVLCTKLGEPTADSEQPSVIDTRLEGESEGFNGETIFSLRNGQIWQQIDGYYRYKYKYAPKVLIYHSGPGFKLRLEGIDRAVSVRRLR